MSISTACFRTASSSARRMGASDSSRSPGPPTRSSGTCSPASWRGCANFCGRAPRQPRPASAWRTRIVPEPNRPAACAAAPSKQQESPPPAGKAAKNRASRIPWAELLLRVFREDVLLCPCGARRVVLAFITERKVVKEILEHLGLPTTGPPLAPARIASADDEAPWQDDVTDPQQSPR